MSDVLAQSPLFSVAVILGFITAHILVMLELSVLCVSGSIKVQTSELPSQVGLVLATVDIMVSMYLSQVHNAMLSVLFM